MSISIAKMVEQLHAFEDNQLKAFKAFIDTSKRLKGAAKTIENKAHSDYELIHNLVQSVSDSMPSNGMHPIAILESDQGYVKALEPVRLLPLDVNQPNVSREYMQTFIKQVAQEMRNLGAENE